MSVTSNTDTKYDQDKNLDDSTYINHEQSIMKFWSDNDIYKLILDSVSECPKITFTDGPPFVSAKTLHFGHILVSYIKDTILRYYYMNGFNCSNKIGFDCHGLPMEMVAYKELNISTSSE